MTGVLNVLKPPGMTSHDVVDFVRGLVGRRTKVGHAGTLDPAAAGVLALCLGGATKLVEYIMAGDKAYRAEIALGVATDSLDTDGTITQEADASDVTRAQVAQAIEGLVGDQMMTPPMYSAEDHAVSSPTAAAQREGSIAFELETTRRLAWKRRNLRRSIGSSRSSSAVSRR